MQRVSPPETFRNAVEWLEIAEFLRRITAANEGRADGKRSAASASELAAPHGNHGENKK